MNNKEKKMIRWIKNFIIKQKIKKFDRNLAKFSKDLDKFSESLKKAGA